MRKKANPLGLLIACLKKANALPLEYYLEKYSSESFNRSFEDLEDEERRNEVYIRLIGEAGRANPSFTLLLKTASIIARNWAFLSVRLSLYITAENWQEQLGREGTSRTGTIISGEIGVAAGYLVGDTVGTTVGSIIGSIILGFNC
ncbi:hypothetical protein F5884DRAFT_880265 [Xylogone sp. PMI_703]|nr:hypothetical protein F5884DRAFT_880265 [Xylogone sp. PMI_703]